MINSLFESSGYGLFEILIIGYNFILIEISRILILFCILHWYVILQFWCYWGFGL